MSLESKAFTAPARLWHNWPVWGGSLAMILLAQHVWVLFSPAERALPGNTAIPESSRTGQLFGSAGARSAATASLDGIRPIGIFAHSQRGFAVMQTPAGQRGVGLGNEVAPGIRLIETHANHVILERDGVRQRVDLSVTTAAGITVQTPDEPSPKADATPLEKPAPEQQEMMETIMNNDRGMP